LSTYLNFVPKILVCIFFIFYTQRPFQNDIILVFWLFGSKVSCAVFDTKHVFFKNRYFDKKKYFGRKKFIYGFRKVQNTIYIYLNKILMFHFFELSPYTKLFCLDGLFKVCLANSVFVILRYSRSEVDRISLSNFIFQYCPREYSTLCKNIHFTISLFHIFFMRINCKTCCEKNFEHISNIILLWSLDSLF
jgi:hypothetical protein